MTIWLPKRFDYLAGIHALTHLGLCFVYDSCSSWYRPAKRELSNWLATFSKLEHQLYYIDDYILGHWRFKVHS